MDRYDIVIVGAGIHGAGIAQAAACAGYRVLVLEKTAPAAGTSSKSSKLIHGGLRYLESGQFRLVRESLAERAWLLDIAPGLVHLTPFHIPVFRDGARTPATIRAGLMLYALLGKLERTARFETVPGNLWHTLDGLDTRHLHTVFRYFDAQTDDVALTRAVLRAAQSVSAELRCPAQFLSAVRHENHCEVTYTHQGHDETCEAVVLINAGGPWINEILARVTPALPPFGMDLVQGTHLVLDEGLCQGAYYVEARDRRAVFVLPWQGHTLLGTTERIVPDGPEAVAPTQEEEWYLLELYRQYFPGRDARVITRFAGARVLPRAKGRETGGTAFGRPRHSAFLVDNAARPRLVTICGGKLTGYAATAEKVLTLVAPQLPRRKARGDARRQRLSAG